MVPMADLLLVDLVVHVPVWIDDVLLAETLVIPPRPGPTLPCSDAETLPMALVPVRALSSIRSAATGPATVRTCRSRVRSIGVCARRGRPAPDRYHRPARQALHFPPPSQPSPDAVFAPTRWQMSGFHTNNGTVKKQSAGPWVTVHPERRDLASYRRLPGRRSQSHAL